MRWVRRIPDYSRMGAIAAPILLLLYLEDFIKGENTL